MSEDRSKTLLGYFERVAILNLPARKDRRGEMERQLRGVGAGERMIQSAFFPAVRPVDKGHWPSIGARGCFLSHLSAIREARDRRVKNLLLIEDDCDFTPLFLKYQNRIVEVLSDIKWDFVFLGHIVPIAVVPSEPRLIDWTGPLLTTHLYAVNHAIYDRLLHFLEVAANREAEHPLGGPQHYDGALNMFREQNPDIVTLICAPALGIQRSSRSDITNRWFDRVPVLRTGVSLVRNLRRDLLR